MRVPVIPLVVATTLIAGSVFLFKSASSGRKTFGQARIERLVDLTGNETEVALAPDGARLLAVASGDLWLFEITTQSPRRITETIETESFPAWAPDGKRLTFTRGRDTFTTTADDPPSSSLFRENATSLSWSPTGRLAFVRDRALWITDAAGGHERALIEADANPDITIQQPRFSPDSTQVAYVRSNRGFYGDVWVADATNGQARELVADRWAENPLDVGWLNSNQLVYLTDRSGAYALWVVDFAANTISPLTVTLDNSPLERIGMAVHQDRILLPRHFVDSNIVVSDGGIVAQTPEVEFQPAASRDGKQVAYTIRKDKRFELWTSGIDGSSPVFRALGTQPRFSPNGFEIVYTHTDIEGRVDIRNLDLRDNSSETLTDAYEIDFQPDWSPDGRTIAFASGQGGTMAVWNTPANGGKRLRLNDGGYYPRFSSDGRFLSYWSQEALWIMDAGGGQPRRARSDIAQPVPAVWVKGAPRTYLDPEIHGGRSIWPQFDVLPDGRLLTAPIEIRETALWTVTLTYVDRK